MTPAKPPSFKKYRRKRWPWALGALAALAIFAGGFLYLNAKSMLDAFREGDKARIVDSAESELGKNPTKELSGLRPGTTFLLVGSDTRPGENGNWGRSDTILVAKVFPKDRAVSILSIPRDMLVYVPGVGETKINHAYREGGPKLLIRTVRDFIGVRIDHYFQIGFDGFGQLVQEFGGVYLPIDQRYKHKNDGGSDDYMEIDLRPGYQKLRAYDALSFVRFRHWDSDFYRAARQQLFLREVSRQLSEKAGGSLMEIRGLAQAIAEAGASDFSSLSEAARLANTLRRIPPSRVVRMTMNGTGVMINGEDFVQTSDEEKARVLRLWNNPNLSLSGQKERRGESTVTGDTILSAIHALGSPVSKLHPWPGWNGAYALTRGTENNLRLSFLESQTRKLLTGKEQKKQGKKSRKKKKHTALAPNPRKLLVENPMPGRAKSRGLSTCRPQYLPSGYYWPAKYIHRYTLAKKPAMAAYATVGSGNSILWMWSNWDEAPILSNPDDGINIGGKVYDVWWESGSVRMIAWQKGQTHIWITNTLQNKISPDEMISLARSCS